MNTKNHLSIIRINIKTFMDITGKYPESLSEIRDCGKNDPHLPTIAFKEYISNKTGVSSEHETLNGKGGWFYDKNTGQLRVNVTKPVKEYLKIYFGKERNQVPSNW